VLDEAIKMMLRSGFVRIRKFVNRKVFIQGRLGKSCEAILGQLKGVLL